MTLSEITKGLETAVAAVDGKRVAKAEAEQKAAEAGAAYEATLSKVRELHAAYSEFMGNILTNFGKVHK